MKTARGAADGAAVIAQEEPLIILVDVSGAEQYQAFENAIQEAVGLFSEKVNSNYIHFISSEQLENIPYLIHSPMFGHYILRKFSDPKESGEHYGHLIKTTVGDRSWGLAPLLKAGTKVQTVRLTSSVQKNDAVEAVKTYLVAAKFHARMATVIANAVDELLLNAIYDAPTDDLGKPILNRTPRSTVMELQGKSQVEMQIGFDGVYVGVTAIDMYGSLEKDKLLAYIAKVYEKEEYKPKTSVAGAGLGLATVFRSGGSFLFVSESRVRTEVTVFFRRSNNFRDFKDQFRFISTQFYF